MKVLHLISGGETGGSKNHLLSLLEQFPKDEVILGVMQEGLLSKEAEELGLKVVHFKQSSRYDFSVIKKLAELIKKEKIDILHTHGPRANLFGYFVKRKAKFMWMSTIHSDPSKDFIKGGVKGKVFTKINMMVLKKIDHFFAVSHRFKEMLVGFGISEQKITVIYNGISFDVPKHEVLERNNLGIAEDDFVITMVARLHPIKGHEVTFKALAEVIKIHPGVKLLLIGDGPMKQELVEMVNQLNLQQNVKFEGFQKNIHGYLSLVDVNLLTSYSESFPLVLLESARAKTPIITSDVGGVQQLIPDATKGWIVPIKDVHAVEMAIRDAITKKENGLLSKMGDNLYEYAKDHFSIRHLYEDIRKLYEVMINK